MKQISLFLLCIILFWGCKEKKTSLSDDDSVAVPEFIDFFPERELPILIADTLLTKRQNDSLLIGYKIFTQFVPDSVLTNDFGKSTQVKLYPLGRSTEKNKETYLVVKAVSDNKRAAYLICFDKNNRYLNAITLVRTGFKKWSSAYGELDKKFQVTTYREQKKGDEISYKRNVYMYNSADTTFTLILTEPNEDIIEGIINPIDTLPATSNLAGDYVQNENNFITFRDGKNAAELLLFIHFEKDKGECVGELRGTAKVIDEKTVQFSDMGNPCKLEFTFTKTGVVMKELEGCGSYRDFKCFFEGTFPKKKVAKAKTPSKKG